MTFKYIRIISGLLAALLLQACVGIDSTAFYAKSNVGVEVNASPANAAIDISRDEGVITPQFSGGKTLPVLASFKNESDGLFSGLVGSTFATGKAAVTMAHLYDSLSKGPIKDSHIVVPNIPQKGKGSDASNPLQTNDIKPVLFSTKTSVGLRLGWLNATALLPSNFTLGYNRQEMALLPVSYENVDGEHRVDQASLLATLGFVYDTVNVNPNTNDNNTKPVTYLQYFATGQAATELATKPEVRSVMINRLDPEAKVNFTAGAVAIMDGVTKQLEVMADKDKYVGIMWDKVSKKTYKMSDGLSSNNIVAYVDSKGNVVRESKANSPFEKKDFKELYKYVYRLEENIDRARENLAKLKEVKGKCEAAKDGEKKPSISYQSSDKKEVWKGCPKAKNIDTFVQNLAKMEAEYIKHYHLLAKDTDVATLFKYYISRISSGV